MPDAYRAAVRGRPHRHDRPAAHRRDRRSGRRPRPVHLLHRARPAARPDPVSEASDRARHDAGGAQPPADQDQHRGRHPADLRVVAAADAADDPPDGGREEQARIGRLADYRQHLPAARLAALPAALRRGHRLLLLLLRRRAVQQRGNRRQSEAPRRLHPRHPSRQGDRELLRLSDEPHHGDRCGLSRADLPHSGDTCSARPACPSISAAPAS